MDPYVAEIRMFAGNFAPTGWALCNGQLLPISQNTALFSLLGTSFGGDGRTTFALPNLVDAAPMGQGQGPGLSQRFVGEQTGSPTITLLATELPSHSHAVSATTAGGTSTSPAGAVWGEARIGRQTEPMYGTAAQTTMAPGATAAAGGGQPHNNLPPYLTLTFIIALQGVYPPRA
jgi:microcystin-dependent protein